MENTQKQYKRNIVLDYLHMFFRNSNFTHGIWVAFLLVKGFSLLDVGIFEMVFHMSGLLMEVPTGVIGDLYGRRTSRLLGITSYFVYLIIVLFSSNYILLIIGFIFGGTSYTFESGSADALVYDSLKETGDADKFMKINGIREMIYQAATVIVLFLTGLFLEGRHETDFYLTAVMYIIAFVIIFNMKETHLPHQAKNLSFKDRINNHFVKTWKVVRGNKRLLLLIVFGALLLAPVTSMFIFAQDYFTFSGFRESWMLYFLAFHALTAAVGALSAERLEHKIGETKLMIILPLLFLICFWITLVPFYGFIGFILIGFIDSVFYVVLVEYMNRLIPSETRASVLSFFGMCFSTVMILIFPLMGLIGSVTTIWYSFLFLAIVITVIVVGIIILVKKKYFDLDNL